MSTAAPKWAKRMQTESVDATPLEAPADVLDQAERDRTLDLMRNLAARGFVLTLEADGDEVSIESDRQVQPELVARLKERKASIVAVLQAQRRAAERLVAMRAGATERRTVTIETIWGRVRVVPERSAQPMVAEVTWAELADDPWGAVRRAHLMAMALDGLKGRVVGSETG